MSEQNRLAPVRFNPHQEDSPHDLMANRRKKSDQKLGKDMKAKARQKKQSREHLKMVDSDEQKKIKKMKETVRKMRQRDQTMKLDRTHEEKEDEKMKEKDRKRVYRAKVKVNTTAEKKGKAAERKEKVEGRKERPLLLGRKRKGKTETNRKKKGVQG